MGNFITFEKIMAESGISDKRTIVKLIAAGVLPPLQGRQRNAALQGWSKAYWDEWYAGKAREKLSEAKIGLLGSS